MPSPRPIRRIAGGLLVAVAIHGCGYGAGPSSSSPTEIRITRDYGATTITEPRPAKAGDSDRPVDVLRANAASVQVRDGRVRSIGGLSADAAAGWYLYVNGVLVDLVPRPGRSAPEIHDGDRVWWDFHARSAAGHAPAVIGAYPEPFVHGIDGRRLPTRVECVTEDDDCQAVQDRLVALGLPAAKGGIAASFTKDTLRILVGSWTALRSDATARLLERGPAVSGVFARLAADGRSIALLDASGRVTRTLGPGGGLIAAVRAGQEEADPMWIVTGTDARGVALAAGALDEGALSGRFAVALAAGRPIALPDGR